MDYWLNREVIKALQERRMYVGDRRSGKTFTLLTHVAMCTDMYVPPVMVVPSETYSQHIQWIWGELFPNFPPIRFIYSREALRPIYPDTGITSDGVPGVAEWAENARLKFLGGVL